LFYAAPSSKRAIFLEQLRDELGNRCVALFSQTTEVGAEHGYINSEVIQRHLKSPSKYQYYICGPEGMMHSSVDALKELGVPKSQIHQEAFAF
jgi:predicted ferric reductase